MRFRVAFFRKIRLFLFLQFAFGFEVFIARGKNEFPLSRSVLFAKPFSISGEFGLISVTSNAKNSHARTVRIFLKKTKSTNGTMS
jgi:hypothetical protein